MLAHATLRAALVALLLPAFAHAQDLNAERERFRSALAAVRGGSPLLPGFEAHPLYAYLYAAWLQRQLLDASGSDTDARIAGFLKDQRDALHARELRRAWLLDLARREQWPVFLQHYDEPNDLTLRCHWLTAQLAEQAPGWNAIALERWMTAEELPPACEPTVVRLRELGSLTPERVEARTRLALKAGRPALAKKLAPQLPEAQREPLLRWARLLESPKPELEKLIASPKLAVEEEALLDGFAKLARRRGADARELYEPLVKRRHVPKDKRVPFRRELALGLALDREDDALKHYRRVPAARLDERGHEWRLRAAIWAGDWKQLREWIAELPPSLAAQSRWRYWSARALQETGRGDAARAAYETLAADSGYHSVLAAQRLERDYTPSSRALPDNAPLRVALMRDPGLTRAREAGAIGEYAWAAAEWRLALARLSRDEQMQAVRLAAAWGLYEQAVSTAAGFQIYDDYELLYPYPFQPEVAAGSALSGVPPALLYSVMRQESLFRPDAVSSAGALGLLQLLPSTARGVAVRWDRGSVQPDDLKRPDTNVSLGAAHLRELSDAFGGRHILALASYNAGANAVRRWLPEKPADAEAWIENIPYNETRGYVQKILWNMVVYGWKVNGQPQNLSALLQPISAALIVPES